MSTLDDTKISDKIVDNTKKIKILKDDRNKDVQLKIKNQIIEILFGKTDDVKTKRINTFILSNLDADKEKQAKIMNLVPEIKKYFTVGPLFGNITHGSIHKRIWLSLARYVFKKTGVKFTSKSCVLKDRTVPSSIICKYTFTMKYTIEDTTI